MPLVLFIIYNRRLTKGIFFVFQLRDHCHTAEGQWSHSWRTIVPQLRDEKIVE